jgi:hypothetical protein
MHEIEERAERELAAIPSWLWDGERLPVPIEDIADTRFGLLVRDVEDLSAAPGAPELPPEQSLSGLLLPALGEIWVNAAEAREWPPRRRFTIGHELGHWVLHRTGQQSLFCRSTSIATSDGPEEPRLLAPDDPGLAAGAPRRGAAVGTGRRRSRRPPAPNPEVIEEEASVFAAALLMPAHLVRAHHARLGGDIEKLQAVFGASRRAMTRRVADVIGEQG